MKNIYNFVYSLNNTDDSQNYFVNIQELEEKECLMQEIFDDIELSPSQGVVDTILKFAHTV